MGEGGEELVLRGVLDLGGEFWGRVFRRGGAGFFSLLLFDVLGFREYGSTHASDWRFLGLEPASSSKLSVSRA